MTMPSTSGEPRGTWGAAPPGAWGAPPPAPPPPRARSVGRRVVWVFALLLLLLGLAGFGLAALVNSSNHDTFAEEYQALGDRDAAAQTEILDARLTAVMRAYNAYVASAERVHTRHEAVTDQFNRVVKAKNAGDAVKAAEERTRLGPVIARYRAALAREQARRAAYLTQLARLDRETNP